MSTQTTRGRNRRQRQGGLIRLLFAAVLLGMLLTPMMSRLAGAEDLDGIDPVVLDELPLEEITEEPLVDLQFPDVELLADEPVLENVEPNINDLFVNPIYCPSDLDLFSVDYYGLAAACNGLGHANGYELIVSDSGGGWWLQAIIDNFGAGQSGLPDDTYYIALTHPASGLSYMRYICSADDMLGNDVVASFEIANNGFGASLGISGGLMWYCDVFINQTGPSANPPTVTIHKWECPSGIELGQDVNFYLTECALPIENVEFAHGQLGGLAELAYTDAAGEIGFEVDTNTDWAVEEHVPSGFGDPIVFCGWGGYKYDDFGGVIAIDGFANLDGSQGSLIEFQTYDSFGMDCNWFNIPSDDEQSITVYKYTCPPGYDLDAATADPQTDCVEPTNGVNFHLLPDGGSELQTMTGDSINGAVSFGGVGFGGFKIWEDAPAGTVDTYVTCQWFENLGPYVYQQFMPVAFNGSPVGNAINVNLSQGDELICQWYNAPEITWDGGDLTIYKYWCTGYLVSDSACELGSGVKFVVAPLGGGGPILTETGPGGFADLNGLTAGAYQVTEKDYEWCKAVSSRVDAEGNVVIEEDQETVLKVYNCTPDTGKKDPPVKKFPNTGAGNFQPGTDDELILLGGILILAQVMMIAALRGKGVSLATVAARIRRQAQRTAGPGASRFGFPLPKTRDPKRPIACTPKFPLLFMGEGWGEGPSSARH